jgi:cytoskeletal protein CcmA (bactofilin family)
LLVSPKAAINGGVEADRVVVNGRVEGPIRGSEVVLKSRAHVVGDIQHQNLSIERGAYFEGRSVRSPETNVRKAPEKLTAKLRKVTELKATRELVNVSTA